MSRDLDAEEPRPGLCELSPHRTHPPGRWWLPAGYSPSSLAACIREAGEKSCLFQVSSMNRDPVIAFFIAPSTLSGTLKVIKCA